MPFVSGLERLAQREGEEIGRQQGQREGLLSGLEIYLKHRFGKVGEEIVNEMKNVAELAKLTQIQNIAYSANDPSEIRKALSNLVE